MMKDIMGTDVPVFFMPKNSVFDTWNEPLTLSSDDLETIRCQMAGRKFDESILLGSPVRCAFGKPQVLLCKSVKGGKPFPTNFWLSCPRLARIAGMAESDGGVAALDKLIKEEALNEWIDYNRRHALIRIELADELELKELENSPSAYANFMDNGIGIGGIRYGNDVHVKCLHLQFASLLALGYHPGRRWLDSLKEGTCSGCGREE